MPALNCPGNHDQRLGRSLEIYCREIGRSGKPPYYAVTIGDVHVLLLDLESAWHRARFVVPAEVVGRQERHRFTIVDRHKLYVRIDAVRFVGAGLRYAAPDRGVLSADEVAAMQRAKEPGLPEDWKMPADA